MTLWTTVGVRFTMFRRSTRTRSRRPDLKEPRGHDDVQFGGAKFLTASLASMTRVGVVPASSGNEMAAATRDPRILPASRTAEGT